MASKASEHVKNMQIAIANNINYSTVLKNYDSGRYLYTLTAIHDINNGMYFVVNQHDNKTNIENSLNITEYDMNGCIYNTSIFRVPDNLVKNLLQFVRAVKLLRYN